MRQADGPWLGVYFWARFNTPPDSRARPYPRLPKQLIYVGDTKHLDQRPLTGRHHRLANYRDIFSDDPGLTRLYVSVYRVHRFVGGYNHPRKKKLYAQLRVYTQFLEASFYWRYTKLWGRPPALHYKKGKSK